MAAKLNRDENARFDLDFLRDFCEGDEDQINYFLEKFKQQYPVEMERLSIALQAGDKESVAKVAHSFRPQLDFVGLKDDSSLVFELEHNARSGQNLHALLEIFNRIKGWQY